MAQRGINKATLIGYVGQEPEVRYMTNGGAVVNLSIATSESWKDKQTGEERESTEWHRVVIFGKLAEITGEYVKKGSQIYIEGKLQTRKWVDQTGTDRYTTEIIVHSMGGVMQILGHSNGKEQLQVDENLSAPQPPMLSESKFDDDIHF